MRLWLAPRPTSPTDNPRKSRYRWLRRIAIFSISPPLAYLLAVLVGLFPANRDFRDDPQGIDIYVYSNGVHTDLIVPAANDIQDWTALLPPTDFLAVDRPSSHVQLGWGDRVFYLDTPTWSDVRVHNVLRAMFWSSKSVMHAAYLGRPLESDDCRRITLSPRQYAQLVTALSKCFRYDDQGRIVLIPDAGYGANDAFYEATGNYHLLNTCNCWTGQMLRTAGVRCGIWTPNTLSVMWTIPRK